MSRAGTPASSDRCQNGVRLEDLGSKNGTTLGGERIRSAVALRDGNRLAFGTVVGVYRTSGEGMSTGSTAGAHHITRRSSPIEDDTELGKATNGSRAM